MPASHAFLSGQMYSCEEMQGQILLGGMQPVLCVRKHVIQGCAQLAFMQWCVAPGSLCCSSHAHSLASLLTLLSQAWYLL